MFLFHKNPEANFNLSRFLNRKNGLKKVYIYSQIWIDIRNYFNYKSKSFNIKFKIKQNIHRLKP